MGFGSFSSNDENTSFEQGLSVNQTTKNVAKASAAQVKKISDDTTKAIVDQLYGKNTPSADNPGQQSGDASQSDHSQQSSALDNAQHPEDQGKLDETRKKLQALQHTHKQNYYDKYLSDDAMRRIRQEEQQKKQQEAQAEDEERQRQQAEMAQSEGPLLPAGKKTGAMMGKKQQQPVALKQATTKTEINRGSSG